MNEELRNTREAATQIGNVCQRGLRQQKEKLRNFAANMSRSFKKIFIHTYAKHVRTAFNSICRYIVCTTYTIYDFSRGLWFMVYGSSSVVIQ